MSGTFTSLLTHVIFSTKHREPIIPEDFEQELFAYIGGIIRNHNGHLVGAGGTSDHVHLLALFSPVISISEIMQKIKGDSSRWINKEKKIVGHFSWQQGYGAFAVSESKKDVVMQYIQNQKEHHRKQTFKEEFLEFLERHKIEYDERYIWD